MVERQLKESSQRDNEAVRNALQVQCRGYTDFTVMAGPACAKPKRLRFGEGRLVPAIHVSPRRSGATWMPGSGPGMTMGMGRAVES
jgi:hypothetical protein